MLVAVVQVVHQVQEDQLDQPAHLDRKEPRVKLEHLETPVIEVIPGHQDQMEHQALKDHKEKGVLLVKQVLLDHQGQLVLQGSEVNLEAQDQEVKQDRKGLQDLRDPQDQVGLLVKQDHLALRVLLVNVVQQVQQVLLDHLVLMDGLDSLVIRD